MGGDCDAGGNVTLVAGNDYTCTITNTYVPPFVPNPAIQIEKATNGFDADNPPGPSVVVGSTVTWTYVVTNTGNVPLANVTVTDDQAGVTPVYQGGDTNTNNLLDLTETWTYQATGTAVAGQYANIGTVTGFYPQGEEQVDDNDPSHYVGYVPTVDEPAIQIEKATNGFDADNPPGPSVVVGSTVTWTYVVTNTGNVPLANVTVTDDQAGVTPVYQGGDTNTNNLLDLTETWTYQATGTAVAGQYANIGTVTGFYPQGEEQVDDTDPSHYVGYVPTVDEPAIQIEKATNGVDADTPAEGLPLEVGSNVTWTYVVTNTGDVTLTNVKVTDDKLGDISCPKNTLAAGESMTCTASGTAELVQYANLGTVTGSYGVVTVTDTDPSHYSGVAVGGTAQLGDTVWLDANNNGVQDNGEVGYNGAKVILKDGDGNVVGTLTTATGAWVGFYKFVGLDAGTYTAMLDLSTIGSYGVTTANSFTVTLAEGDDYLDADFGLYQAPPTTTVPHDAGRDPASHRSRDRGHRHPGSRTPATRHAHNPGNPQTTHHRLTNNQTTDQTCVGRPTEPPHTRASLGSRGRRPQNRCRRQRHEYSGTSPAGNRIDRPCRPLWVGVPLLEEELSQTTHSLRRRHGVEWA